MHSPTSWRPIWLNFSSKWSSGLHTLVCTHRINKNTYKREKKDSEVNLRTVWLEFERGSRTGQLAVLVAAAGEGDTEEKEGAAGLEVGMPLSVE